MQKLDCRFCVTFFASSQSKKARMGAVRGLVNLRGEASIGTARGDDDGEAAEGRKPRSFSTIFRQLGWQLKCVYRLRHWDPQRGPRARFNAQANRTSGAVSVARGLDRYERNARDLSCRPDCSGACLPLRDRMGN
jgi:hypothetical protein